MSVMLPRNSLILVAALVSLSYANDGDISKRALTPEDIVGIRWFTSPALTSDGKVVAYVLVEWDTTQAQAERKRTIWLAPTDGSQPPRRFAVEHERVAQPSWSPDGKQLAFLSGKDAKAAKQFFLIVVHGSKPVQLTNEFDGIRFYKLSSAAKSIP